MKRFLTHKTDRQTRLDTPGVSMYEVAKKEERLKQTNKNDMSSCVKDTVSTVNMNLCTR